MSEYQDIRRQIHETLKQWQELKARSMLNLREAQELLHRLQEERFERQRKGFLPEEEGGD